VLQCRACLAGSGPWILGWFIDSVLIMQLGIILAAHIAADRTLGYGLKRKSGFKDTHLGRIG